MQIKYEDAMLISLGMGIERLEKKLAEARPEHRCIYEGELEHKKKLYSLYLKDHEKHSKKTSTT